MIRAWAWAGRLPNPTSCALAALPGWRPEDREICREWTEPWDGSDDGLDVVAGWGGTADPLACSSNISGPVSHVAARSAARPVPTPLDACPQPSSRRSDGICPAPRGDAARHPAKVLAHVGPDAAVMLQRLAAGPRPVSGVDDTQDAAAAAAAAAESSWAGSVPGAPAAAAAAASSWAGSIPGAPAAAAAAASS